MALGDLIECPGLFYLIPGLLLLQGRPMRPQQNDGVRLKSFVLRRRALRPSRCGNRLKCNPNRSSVAARKQGRRKVFILRRRGLQISRFGNPLKTKRNRDFFSISPNTARQMK